MSKPEQVSPLQIGFLGYNARQTMYGMKKFAEENKENIDYFRSTKDRMVFTDGTLIFPLLNVSNIVGQKFDQLILFGDDFEISKLKKTLQELGCRSCVSEEYRIMQYN